MVEQLETAKAAILGLHLQKHMTDPESAVAQHAGFAEMVKTTNLFDNINRVLSAARQIGIFMAYVKLDLSPGRYRYPLRGEFCQFVAAEHQAGEVLRPGAWGYDLHDALVCQQDEPVILGRHISAFAGSDLDNALKTRGITDLVLTGVATNFVVTNTAWSAIDRGYSCLVLEDCCTSGSAEMHQDAIDHLRPIADIWQSHSLIDAMTR